MQFASYLNSHELASVMIPGSEPEIIAGEGRIQGGPALTSKN